jgi:hypothetical protein
MAAYEFSNSVEKKYKPKLRPQLAIRPLLSASPGGAMLGLGGIF